MSHGRAPDTYMIEALSKLVGKKGFNYTYLITLIYRRKHDKKGNGDVGEILRGERSNIPVHFMALMAWLHYKQADWDRWTQYQ